jgi:hypothetical protein
MSGNDWCHFSQRLPRSRDHMLLKDADVPFEDERYSYVVVTREKVFFRRAYSGAAAGKQTGPDVQAMR